MTTNPIRHVVPPLPYAASALEPHIDARSLVLHHDMHHAAYVSALNKAGAWVDEDAGVDTALRQGAVLNLAR